MTNYWPIAVLVLVLAGCSREENPANPILVKVGDQSITAEELQRFEAGLPARLRGGGVAGRRQNLQSLVDRRLLVLAARKLGLDQSSQVQQALDEQLTRKVIEQVNEVEIEAKQQAPTEEEVKAAYERHQLGWQVWPAHILSNTKADAEEVIRALKEGADFASLAKQRSQAEDAERGGDLGKFFGGEDAVPVLREGTFELPAGGISQPLQTKDGYEVVKVLDKRRIPYEKMRDTIIAEMKRRKWAERRQQYLSGLKERFQVHYHGEVVPVVLQAAKEGTKLSPEVAAGPLVSYQGGVLLAGVCVEHMRQWTKGPLPADSLGLFNTLDLWVLPDTLMALAGRAEGRDQQPETLVWKEKKREELAVDQLFAEQVSAQVKVDPAEAERYYQEHQDDFRVLPGEVQLTEVLVDTEVEARKVLRAAQAGEKLEVLAEKYSRRPKMKPLGGHLYKGRGQLVISPMYHSPYHDFFGDANTKDVGVFQGPLLVQDKYSVFRLDQPVMPAPLPLSQVRRPILHRLRKGREAAAFDQYIAGLRSQYAAQVKWFEDALARLESPPAAATK
ncbi:MAG: hypothetical protein EXS58_09095 [Candidatus Latescibacteria bacterium]|nr:hypothetical protein [Candidatus Latescibacterota bacterium]